MVSNFAYGKQVRPYRAWKSVTPDDGSDLDAVPRALVATGAGNIAIRDGDDNDITLAVAASEVIDFSPVRVLATGTTATGIFALY